MEEEAVNRVVQEAIGKLKKEMSMDMEKIKEENKKVKEEVQALRDENKKLKNR